MKPRARRGDVRAAILVLLEETPMHGYQILRELTERSAGAWKPSSGSVYPTLGRLERDGLIASEEIGGRRIFALTAAGKAQAALQERAPWDVVIGEHKDRIGRLREAVDGLASVTTLVEHTGTDEQTARTIEVLLEARKSLYRMLADAE